MPRFLVLILAAAMWPAQSPDPLAFAIPDYFKGGFTQTQKAPGGSDETIEITGSGLIWTRQPTAAMKDFAADPDSSATTPAHDADVPTYRLTAGSITVKISGHSSGNGATCTIEGEQTYSVASLPPAAFSDFKLAVYPDKSYTLMMWMHSRALAVTTTHVCHRFKDTLTSNIREDGITVIVGQRTKQPMGVRGSDASWVIAGTSNIPVPFSAVAGSWNFVGLTPR